MKNERYALIGTLLWLLAIAGAFLLSQTLVLAIYLQLNTPTSDTTQALQSLAYNGTVLAWATLVSGVLCTLLIALAIRLKRGLPFRRYLGFQSSPVWEYLFWIGAFVVLLIVAEATTYFAGKDSVPSFMQEVTQSASSLWLLWLAIVVMAPLFEELLIRGFVQEGLAQTFLGPMLAVVISAALWASIHLQYEPFYIGVIFVFGLFFGYAKHKTGNLWIPIILHAINNLISMVQTHLVLA